MRWRQRLALTVCTRRPAASADIYRSRARELAELRHTFPLVPGSREHCSHSGRHDSALNTCLAQPPSRASTRSCSRVTCSTLSSLSPVAPLARMHSAPSSGAPAKAPHRRSPSPGLGEDIRFAGAEVIDPGCCSRRSCSSSRPSAQTAPRLGHASFDRADGIEESGRRIDCAHAAGLGAVNDHNALSIPRRAARPGGR
jgi:hypothetical protein